MRNNDKRLVHGTLEGYKSFGCRCLKCKEIWELYTQEFRDQIFDDTKARRKKIDFIPSEEDYSERKRRY